MTSVPFVSMLAGVAAIAIAVVAAFEQVTIGASSSPSSSSNSTSSSSPSPSQNQGPGTGGTITGRVLLTATAPPNASIRMGADLKCLELNAGKPAAQDVVLRDADGGLRNVFVNVQGSFPQAPPPPTTPVTIEQHGCVYQPRIQGARVGQTLEVKNDDDTLHNIHSLSTKGNEFNTGQPKAGMVFKYPLKNEEVMLHVRCDVHAWMSGYIGVMSNPYYAVSGEKGAFRIANVPPGKYTVQAWHERYGVMTKTIEVKAGASIAVEFTYNGNEKASAAVAAAIAPDGFVARELAVPHATGVSAAEPVAPTPASR
jgi:hypothetical protein